MMKVLFVFIFCLTYRYAFSSEVYELENSNDLDSEAAYDNFAPVQEYDREKRQVVGEIIMSIFTCRSHPILLSMFTL